MNPDPTTLAEPLDHWFTYVDPRDVAHAVSQAQQAAIRYGTYNIVAGRADTMFDYSAAEEELPDDGEVLQPPARLGLFSSADFVKRPTFSAFFTTAKKSTVS